MNLKINCRICNKTIENPKANQVTCSHKCAEINKKNQIELQSNILKKEGKYKEREKSYNKRYQKAMGLLRDNHKKEFVNIMKALKPKPQYIPQKTKLPQE